MDNEHIGGMKGKTITTYMEGKALDHSQGQIQRILTTCRESSPYQQWGSGNLSGTAHLSK